MVAGQPRRQASRARITHVGILYAKQLAHDVSPAR
jgi:hypothetical protein